MSHSPTRVALLLALGATPALAVMPAIADGRFLSDHGIEYLSVESLTGVAIESREPVTYRPGRDGAPVPGIERLDFARDCHVTGSLLSEGTWSRGPGGVLGSDPGPPGITAVFAGLTTATFPGQSLPGLADACLEQ